jgi:hypothetical protein
MLSQGASEEVATADNQGGLYPLVDHRKDLIGHVLQSACIETDWLPASQGSAAELDDDTSVSHTEADSLEDPVPYRAKNPSSRRNRLYALSADGSKRSR